MTQVPDFEGLIKVSPYPYLFLDRDLAIIGANKAYLRLTGRPKSELIGRHLFDAFPSNPDDPASTDVHAVRASIERAIESRTPDTVAFVRYAIPAAASGKTVYDERYWSIIHTPVLDHHGEVVCISQNAIDVTDLYSFSKKLKFAEVGNGLDFKSEGIVLNRAQALHGLNQILDAERAHLRSMFDQAPGFIAVLRGPDHVFDVVNEAFFHIAGRRNLVGKSVREALPDVASQICLELLDQVFASGKSYVGREMKIRLQPDPAESPHEIYIDFVYQPITAADGSIAGIFVQGQDVTVQKRAQDELRLTIDRLNLAIEGTGDGVWDWNMETNDVIYSPRWKEILGFLDHEFPNRLEAWQKRVNPEDAPKALATLQACMNGDSQRYRNEYRLRCKDGSWKWVLARGIIVARDADNKPLRMTGMTTDISDRRQSEELIWHHANFDTLTGLPNRRLFRDRLGQEVIKANRTGLRVALLFIDLDRFKEANDLLGHDAGDIVLAQAAQRLAACVRESDTVARLGGDEFTVILTELEGVTHVDGIAHKALDTLAQPFRLGNEVVYLSASIGITLYPDDAAEPEDLIKNADQAMYAAKSAGRNQLSYFTRSMQIKANLRLRLAADLRNALAAGQLEVYYQPIVNLTTGHIVKAEALLRWKHPKLGMVPPSQFIPLAEESGLINEIGDWVFKQAASCSQRWSRQLGAPLQISVNKSPVQFLSQTEDVNWSGHLRDLGLCGNSISVEITEGLLLNALPSVAEKLLEYRDAGIQVALDDFGTGYSSMAYLKKFDIDYLKIDQSFVRDMATDAGDRTIAESIIVMAHKLGLEVIAEGIETAEQNDLLVAAGCDFGQGYLYSEAVPSPAFERLLHNDALWAGVRHMSGSPAVYPN